MSWGLVQYLDDHGRRCTGVLADGVVRQLPPPLAARPVADLCDDWAATAEALQALGDAVTTGPEVPGARLLAPLTYPRKVLCAGANYYAHAAEMGTARPDPTARPFFFLKPPTTSVVGPDAVVAMPAGDAVDLDWEAELVVVVSRRARDLTVEQARDHVAGYSVANDLSARGLFHRPEAVMPVFAYDWLDHKGLDGFCPLGPALVPAWLVPDPQDLRIGLTVNGVTKQESSTSDMVVGALELVAAASRVMTLEPGDVILTGTPAGVGIPRGEFLAVGDVVTATIEGIGELTTTIGPPVGSSAGREQAVAGSTVGASAVAGGAA